MQDYLPVIYDQRRRSLICSSLKEVETLQDQSIDLLNYFNASQLLLKSAPVPIGNFINLTHLNLSYCGLATLPAEIGNLVKLQYLSANGNPFISLPTTLIKLINLEYLELRVDDDSSVPSALVANGQIPTARTKDYLKAIYDYYSKPAKDATYQFIIVGRQHRLPKDMLRMVSHLILDSRDDVGWHFRRRIDDPIIPMPESKSRLLCSSDDEPEWCI